MALGQHTPETPTYRKLKASLDRVPAIDTHDHLWPFEGTINWPALIEKFVVAEYRGEFIFETRSDDLGKGGVVRSRLEELWDEAQSSLEEFRLKYKL